DLAQGEGGGRKSAGRLDHRPFDLAGTRAEGARRVRGGVEEDAVFLAAAARRQTAGRSQQGRDGEVPAGHAQVLFEQNTALQLNRRRKDTSRSRHCESK